MGNGAAAASIRTPDQRLRVFVSSTMVELADERRAATEAIRSLHMSPVLFETGARPHPPRELYTAYLQQSDVFIGIYGQNYGWIDPSMSISGIEDEYLLASGKPRLIYLKATPEREKRLSDLLDRITAEGSVSYKTFSTTGELRELIENDLAVLLTERFQSTVSQADATAGGALGASHWQAPPVPLTPLVGQRRLLSAACRLLKRDTARLVVLTGPGGVGKTRLAAEIAGRMRPHFTDGIAWVDLASVQQDQLVLPAIAQAIRLPEVNSEVMEQGKVSSQSILQSLADRLATSHAMIVLDNFEHLHSSAPLLPQLLQRCPHLTVLVTSRESLRVTGEHDIHVEPLTLAESGAGGTRELVLRSEAVQLLLQRAAAVVPGFELTDNNADAIAALCSRVDGLPLGLELTASHLRYLSPRDLLEKVSPGGIPTPASADRPGRQQSLRATLDWSYELLTESQKTLFARLSVLGDGFSLEAAPAVCGWDRPHADVVVDMYSLVDKSLVRQLSGPGGTVRFGMFLTIRDYASERLAATGEVAMIREKHARYYCYLAEAADSRMTGPERQTSVQQLESEISNLRIALDWGLDGGDLNIGLRLVGALGWFWNITGRLVEGSRWVRALLARPLDGCGAREQAGALYCAAALAWRSEQYEEARDYAERAVSLLRPLHDSRRLALALSLCGLVATSERRYDSALAAHEEAYSIFDRITDEWGVAYALSNTGDVHLEAGRMSDAESCYFRALDLFSKTGDLWGQAVVLQTLGNVAWRQGDMPGARAHFRRAVENWRQISVHGNAGALTGLAAATLREGDVAEARELLLLSAKVWRNLGNQTGIALSIEGLAAVRACEGDFREAAILAAAAEAHRAGRPMPYAVEDGLFAEPLRLARENLGTQLFAEARREGRALTIDEALDRASKASTSTRSASRTK